MARFDTTEVDGSPMRICIAAPEAAGHAFQSFLSEERCREEAATDSRDETLRFLGRAFA